MSASIYCSPCSRLVNAAAESGRVACPDCGELLEAPASAEIFISYAREDYEQARQVAELLGRHGISHWLDVERIRLGSSFLSEIADGLVEAKAVLLMLSSRAVRSPWVEAEITDAKSRGLPILPLKIEEFELPRPWRIALAHHQWDEAFDDLVMTRPGRLIERVRTVLLDDAARGAAVAPGDAVAVRPLDSAELEGVDPDVPPYVGPRPFDSRMAHQFFGRQRDAQRLLRTLSESRVVLVYAPSGAGKSSLLNTLIASRLEDQGLDVMLNARVGGALPGTTKMEDIRNIFSYSAIFGLGDAGAARPQWRLTDYLKSIGRKPGTVGRVIVFDQFEEIFTQHRERFEDRAGFIDDVVAALESDPGLRVIFAARQEFLADMDPLAERLPPALAMERFALQRIGTEGALEAITRPAERYATYAPGVAERLVAQLNTIKITRSDGTVVEKPGEFIEMVHLQIVCARLWASLPPGITTIEMSHVEQAAGEGKAVDEFVVNALDSFYDETIEQIVDSPITRANGGFSKKLIQLGCMKFVTPSATRTMVQRANGRTGRLPDWIVEQLENSHLLRAEQRGGHFWYELSHDSLAEPIGRLMDRDVSSLLFASDLLNKVLENALLGNGGELRGYFREHRDVLNECLPFHGQTGLFPDEAEFVFRASLKAGQDMTEWSRSLARDYPDVRVAVLNDALASDDTEVRCNAVRLLAQEPTDELLDTVVVAALEDEHATVRRTAAVALARLDRPRLFDSLSEALQTPATRERALEALTRIRITVDASAAESAFDASLARLPRGERGRITRRGRRTRLRESLPVLPFVVLPAAAFAAVTAPLFKWLPGMYDWALGQATGSAAMGVFHGIIAGAMWAGGITLGLTLYHVTRERRSARKSVVRPFGAITAGAAAGFISSFLLVMTIVGVYDNNALVRMGWISGFGIERFGPEFWKDLFITARYGWPYVITGTGLGVGMALTTNALRASPKWEGLLSESGVRMTGLHDTVTVVRRIMPVVLSHAWLLPAAVGAASVLAFFVPATGVVSLVGAEGATILTKTSPTNLWQGLTADGLTQIIGAYFGICGMTLGMIVMRRGLTVEPRVSHG